MFFKSKLAFAIWPLVGALCYSQVPWDKGLVLEPIGQSQVVFLSAETAEVAVDGERVAIIAEGLSPSRQYGVVVTAPESTKWIEVHDSKKPFPPVVSKPFRDNKYLVRGQPGQTFYLSLRGEGPPVWAEIVIAPEVVPPKPDKPEEPGPDPPKPAPGLDGIEELSKQLADKLDDSATRVALASAITKACDDLDAMCKSGQCPGLPQAKMTVVAAIEQTLALRAKPDKNWLDGWRRPISEAISKLNPVDPPTYISIMRTAAQGLERK